MKKCSKCGVEKSLEDFPQRKKRKDGRDSRCTDCAKIYYQNNKEKLFKRRREHFEENKDRILQYHKDYRQSHKEEFKKYGAKSRNKLKNVNKEEKLQKRREWEKQARDKRSGYKLKQNISRRIRSGLSGKIKSDTTVNLLGCTIEEFKLYLENQFTEGMSWENYGLHGWHIDHIIPCHTFDLTDPEQQKICFHYTNQRPLWAKDNLSRPRSSRV